MAILFGIQPAHIDLWRPELELRIRDTALKWSVRSRLRIDERPLYRLFRNHRKHCQERCRVA